MDCLYFVSGSTKKAALTLLAVDSAIQALESLHAGQFRDLTNKLMGVLMTTEKIDPVLQDAIMMESAKLMVDLQIKKGFDFYCDRLGKKGDELRLELGCKFVG